MQNHGQGKEKDGNGCSGGREYEKKMVTERILVEVRGRMMEDIVLLEAMKAAGRNCRVFKLQLAVGEFDMVVYYMTRRKTAVISMKLSIVRKPSRISTVIWWMKNSAGR